MLNNNSRSQVLTKLLKFRKEREWEQFHKPKELVSALHIEAGELQELFLWREYESVDTIKSNKERYERIQEELADIAIYLTYLCHDLDINLINAIENKLIKNAEKYPVEKYKGKF